MPKTQTREHAHRFGLVVADKPDSQDICFVPTGGYAPMVEKFRPGALDPGEIVDLDGRVLGQHQGIINYTIGQRKGLGISSPHPLYVVKIDPEKKLVIVGPRKALARTRLLINEMNWMVDNSEFSKGKKVIVKIRSTHLGLPARVTLHNETQAIVEFTTPEYGISAGQACVLYEKDHVLGGGWISREDVP
jgi:tRNA-specific 2-thiouridylase